MSGAVELPKKVWTEADRTNGSGQRVIPNGWHADVHSGISKFVLGVKALRASHLDANTRSGLSLVGCADEDHFADRNRIAGIGVLRDGDRKRATGNWSGHGPSVV